MIEIRRYPLLHHLRSDASSHVMKFARGRRQQSGRGLSFWFRPDQVSIAGLPLDDRDMPFVINAKSADFQDLMVQGSLLWRIRDVDTIAERIDFSIDLTRGTYLATPLDHIRSQLSAQIQQAATDYLSTKKVRDALDAGLRALQAALSTHLETAEELNQLGLEIIAIHVSQLSPSVDLARALQTPTFERIQQEADEATFARRALAVEKEQAIAENELATRVELARRERDLIDHEADNARQRAEGEANAAEVSAVSEARRIEVVEDARTTAEAERLKAYTGIPTGVLVALAAREFASKLDSINELNITPDLLTALRGEFQKLTSDS